MFKLTQSPTYWYPVQLLDLDADGNVVSAEIQVQFVRLSVDEEEALRQRNTADRVLAREIMRGWRGVADEQGQALPYGDEARERFLAQPGAAYAVVIAFYESRNQAALGNLMRSRALGQPPSAAGDPGAPAATIRH